MSAATKCRFQNGGVVTARKESEEKRGAEGDFFLVFFLRMRQISNGNVSCGKWAKMQIKNKKKGSNGKQNLKERRDG